jgi:hypothetical protein
MKKFIILIACAMLLSKAQGQENCPYAYGEFMNESEAYLFGDRVNVRAEPNTTSAVVSNKSIGSEVQVLSKSDKTFAMGGYTTNWYLVTFVENGKTLNGFVWGGLISLATIGIPRSDGPADQMVYGISGWSNEKEFTSTVRIIRDGKLLTSLDFEPISSGFFDAGVFGHSVCVKIDDAHGFKGIKNIIRLSFEYAACGYENGEIMLLWDGVKLTYLAKASQVTEAGVFAYTYSLIFPDEPEGKPNTLQVIQEYIETEYVGETENILAHEITTKKFGWDGLKVTEMPEEVKKIK